MVQAGARVRAQVWAVSVTGGALVLMASGNDDNGNSDNSSCGDSNARGHIAVAGRYDSDLLW